MAAPLPADTNPEPETTGITRRPVPAWITDPDCAESIALGLMTIDDEPTGGPNV